MADYVAPDAVFFQRRYNDEQLQYAIQNGNDPTGAYASMLNLHHWSAVSPGAPAGVLQSLGDGGVVADAGEPSFPDTGEQEHLVVDGQGKRDRADQDRDGQVGGVESFRA